jgi:hypothetical protein
MNDKESVIREIQAAFINNEYPGDNFLQGSSEGSEPFEEVNHLRVKRIGGVSRPRFSIVMLVT